MAMMMGLMPFIPPTAEQVQAYLRQHPIRTPSRGAVLWPQALLVASLIGLLMPQGGVVALSWVGLLVFLVVSSRRPAALRAMERRLSECQEMTMLRWHDWAVSHTWKLLPRLTDKPPLYGQALLTLSQALVRLRQSDAALVLLDELRRHGRSDHPAVIQVRLQRVVCLLHTQRLTDADDEVRRLGPLVEASGEPVLKAGLRLAQLYQHVATNHFADAVALSEGLVPVMRPVGVEAGYAYALAALACHHTGSVSTAQAWWQRAKLLLAESELRAWMPGLGVLP